jgi:ATP-dependent Clp protease ATP-binding subunit ClpA
MSRLIGAPPGYVGYEDEDVLVTPLRRRPASVVFFKDFDIHQLTKRMILI